ncbi:MAG: PhoPQ-activated pathogenicity-related family protein [Pirellulaceae bacterium]|nr:PhoPQ-activated pathogenicity-related family protein [Planctomycetales bacterium]
MTFKSARAAALLLTVSIALFFSPYTAAQDTAPEETAIDRYVKQPDPSYTWKVVSSKVEDGVHIVVIDMTSQTWLTPDKVNRTKWQHWVTLAFPEKVKSNVAMLMIGGGSNGRAAPNGPDQMVIQVAKASGTVVAELRMTPNQPLIFHNDGRPRVEDDLIGYCWDQYLQTKDPNWLPRNAMVKGAVRAMDTITAVMASETGNHQTVDQFVVAGASKRGWTTWLTGAVDKRVVGIVPIVIDVLNVNTSMRHHFAAYGFWAPAVGNYVQHRIMERMSDPALEDLYKLVDPFAYRDRLTMPKLVLNAAGDQFFLPDSSQFYWDGLPSPKAIRYVPNTDHGMDGSDAIETVSAFYLGIVNKRPLPQFDWKINEDGTIRVAAKDKPRELRLWQATNPEARDFRLETLGKKYTSQLVELNGEGEYVAKVPEPEAGWTAFFVEATYDNGATVPLKVTSGVRVVPDVLPFAGKDPSQPASVTVIGSTLDKAAAEAIRAGVEALVKQGKFPDDDVEIRVEGQRCYVNWQTAPDRFHDEAGGLAKFLEGQGCRTVSFQLESGPEITLPPNGQLESIGK